MQLATQHIPVADNISAVVAADGRATSDSIAPDELANIVSRFALTDGWMDRVRLRKEDRWYERLYVGAKFDIWAISWMPGQSTGFHDHGESSGAFIVATGVLEEHRPQEVTVTIQAGRPRAFGPNYAHDVRNASVAPAISIHAYSPPLTEMNRFELEGGQLVLREKPPEDAEIVDPEWQSQSSEPAKRTGTFGIDEMLSTARGRLERLSPADAYKAVAKTGAILVDIRPEAQRASEGSIPGALIIERNVLEWRLDPTSEARLPIATDHDLQVIIFCSEGYTSSLAAAVLQDLGLWRATDVVGGFRAWQSWGFPNASPRSSCSGVSTQEDSRVPSASS